MADTGFLSADVAENVSVGGSGFTWDTPSGALTEDASNASISGLLSDTYSDYLVVRDFDIALSAASIVGIEVEIVHDLAVSGEVLNGRVFLTLNGTGVYGFTKSVLPTSGIEETDVIGGPTDLWGGAPTEAQVEATTFGVMFQGVIGNGGGSIDWFINQVRMKIYHISLDTVLPDADIDTTGWTSTPLFSKINDGSDATVIQATAS